MAKNIIINGTTYNGVASVDFLTADGSASFIDADEGTNGGYETDYINIIGGTYGASVTSLPDSVTRIGNYAFAFCYDDGEDTGVESGLALTALPTNLEYIGNNAFIGCQLLAITSIPAGVTRIRANTFYGSGITDLTILGTVTMIGDGAFGYSLLETLTLTQATPPTIQGTPFAMASRLTEIHVPMAAVDTYKAASGWSGYESLIVGY